ncbi:hypothetical protein IV500_06440 [Paeniglutamicibacter antarcticus]|uniref:Uncharacterized protein n=1 Tax=Arthrobacter terrae TaxID=2935737 RepID=A0A931CPA8_9MICC|nr:hypothetical protein [Arthrobacter terrae]MBG0739039.1 hypothetical protein [Arthrobacter terrae]
MNENAGIIRLDTLDQSDYWIDRYGTRHGLTDMPQGYLANVLGFLREKAPGLYELQRRRRDYLLFAAELKGWDNGLGGSEIPESQQAVHEWLESTTLVKTIRTMLEETGR